MGTIGLTLEEGKLLLSGVPQVVSVRQVTGDLEERRRCPGAESAAGTILRDAPDTMSLRDERIAADFIENYSKWKAKAGELSNSIIIPPLAAASES